MNLLSQLRQRNAPLYYTGIIHLVAAGVTLLLILFSQQQLLGINLWIKPFKFMISVSIYLFTLAWLVGDIANKRYVRLFSWQIILCMGVEMLAVIGQAARGVKSHYNTDSVEGIIIYAVMGFFILYSTILIVTLTYRYWRGSFPSLSRPYLWGVRLGLLLFLIGSAEGIYMSNQPGHTVGAADGGAGLTFLNWSTQYGDLRVAHFIGLHGLQVLMLLGAWLGSRSGSSSRSTYWVTAAFVLMLGFTILTYWQAIQQIPLLSLK
ncbi:hypothetical protein [Telluribacter sp. SYSU D00476]|uniref:hypothetical protein n=1 Tax=Telluribacter sp. SYSU D00476 TaxID=2811430 RepID=UPI001FF0E2AC|nr:hypothetical protein [Telluribacter sp. SYSU D00476]